MQFLATTMAGLEEVLAQELRALSVEGIQVHKRAVGFEGDYEKLYQANLHLRTAIRILMPIHTFRCRNENALYKGVQQIRWWDHMRVKDTLAVDSAVNSPHFNHSQYVALKTKDAIVDQFRKKYDKRPSVDLYNPTLRINVHISKDQCTLSLDSSGDSLHKRGYRINKTLAPLNEVLAAGMVLLSGWQGDKPFLDPMCGSGTILVEAAMIASQTAPGLLRQQFGFMKWHDYDEQIWQAVQTDAQKIRKRPQAPIYGLDVDPEAIYKAQKNISLARLKPFIQLEPQDFFSYLPPEKITDGIIVMNPPYDERISVNDIEQFYKKIGDTLKQRYKGYRAWILSANISAIKSVGLRTSQKHTLYNGPLPCKFHRYDMY